MSSTPSRSEAARSFYAASTIALSVAATCPGEPLHQLRGSFGARFSQLATTALGEQGPHLIADVEAERATNVEAVKVGLMRVEASLRRILVGELVAAAQGGIVS